MKDSHPVRTLSLSLPLHIFRPNRKSTIPAHTVPKKTESLHKSRPYHEWRIEAKWASCQTYQYPLYSINTPSLTELVRFRLFLGECSITSFLCESVLIPSWHSVNWRLWKLKKNYWLKDCIIGPGCTLKQQTSEFESQAAASPAWPSSQSCNCNKCAIKNPIKSYFFA